jgi:hypothetical protein
MSELQAELEKMERLLWDRDWASFSPEDNCHSRMTRFKLWCCPDHSDATTFCGMSGIYWPIRDDESEEDGNCACAVVDIYCHPTIGNRDGYAVWDSADELEKSLNSHCAVRPSA